MKLMLRGAASPAATEGVGAGGDMSPIAIARAAAGDIAHTEITDSQKSPKVQSSEPT